MEILRAEEIYGPPLAFSKGKTTNYKSNFDGPAILNRIGGSDHEYRLERVLIFDQPRTPAKIISRSLEGIRIRK